MKLRDCIEIKAGSGWGSERNVLGLIDTKNTPAHSIAGPAEEPTNWQMLGMTSIKLALEHNFNKHYIDPMAWMQLAVMAGGPGSGRHPEGLADHEQVALRGPKQGVRIKKSGLVYQQEYKGHNLLVSKHRGYKGPAYSVEVHKDGKLVGKTGAVYMQDAIKNAVNLVDSKMG